MTLLTEERGGEERGMAGETLLEEFIKRKTQSYTEPTRKGIKGNPPGRISKKKFRAALLQLSNNSQLLIAKRVGVSHALLLKWRTEEPFRRLTVDLLNEFTYLFWKYIREISQKFSPDNIPKDKLSGVGDVFNYSDHLILSIFDFLWRVEKEEFLARGWPVFLIFKDALFSSLSDKHNNLLRIYILYFRFEALHYAWKRVESGKLDDLARFILSILLQHLMSEQGREFEGLHTETQVEKDTYDKFIDRVRKNEPKRTSERRN